MIQPSSAPDFHTQDIIATNLLVPGRGHELGPNGELTLTDSAHQRIGTAALYFKQHEEAFSQAAANGTGGVIVMSGGYAKLASAGRMAAPPITEREAVHMVRQGERWGIPAQYMRLELESTSTMENILNTWEAGHFQSLSPDNPLGIVTQGTQFGRLAYFAEKVFGLPPEAVAHINAPGEHDKQIARDEQKLLRVSRIAYGRANTPRQLRQVESFLGVVAVVADRLHLQKSPATSYIGPSSSQD